MQMIGVGMHPPYSRLQVKKVGEAPPTSVMRPFQISPQSKEEFTGNAPCSASMDSHLSPIPLFKKATFVFIGEGTEPLKAAFVSIGGEANPRKSYLFPSVGENSNLPLVASTMLSQSRKIKQICTERQDPPRALAATSRKRWDAIGCGSGGGISDSL
ncbi:hypothetical protein ISCGN_018479 [Ixodes scapularis]